eukprot:jgi/Chlat1/6129/Chrsp409S05663
MWNYRWSIPHHETATAAIATTCSKMLRLSYKLQPTDELVAIGTTCHYAGHSVLQTLVRAQFSPAATSEQRYVYTGSSCGAVHVYDVVSGKLVRRMGGHGATVRDASRHPYLPIMVTSSVSECKIVHVARWLFTVADVIVALLYWWDCTLGVWEHVR